MAKISTEMIEESSVEINSNDEESLDPIINDSSVDISSQLSTKMIEEISVDSSVDIRRQLSTEIIEEISVEINSNDEESFDPAINDSSVDISSKLSENKNKKILTLQTFMRDAVKLFVSSPWSKIVPYKAIKNESSIIRQIEDIKAEKLQSVEVSIGGVNKRLTTFFLGTKKPIFL
jgi:hypothetical protein